MAEFRPNNHHVDFTKDQKLLARLYECGCRELQDPRYSYLIPPGQFNLVDLSYDYDHTDAEISLPHEMVDCPYRYTKTACPHQGGHE